MAEIHKAPADKAAKTKPAINWPILIVLAVGAAYIIWVWVNSYRVSHAATNPALITATK